MTFVTYAQNFEDLMLWRGLSEVANGFYIDVGAGDPDANTVTRAFYERGWSGVNIEPDPAPFAQIARRRERDVNLPIALADSTGERRFYIPSVPGLGTLDSAIAFQHRARGMEVRRTRVMVHTLAEICRRHAPRDIHFVNIDVQRAELQVLQGADLVTFRPWIILAQAMAPLTRQESHAEWEPLLLAAGYRFVWFDGLNRFYVAEERYAELARHFRLPANCFDQWQRADPEKEAMAAELQAARTALAEERGAARANAKLEQLEAVLWSVRDRVTRLQQDIAWLDRDERPRPALAIDRTRQPRETGDASPASQPPGDVTAPCSD